MAGEQQRSQQIKTGRKIRSRRYPDKHEWLGVIKAKEELQRRIKWDEEHLELLEQWKRQGRRR